MKIRKLISLWVITCLLLVLLPVTALAAEAVTPMYRMYNPNSGEHFYTGSVTERENLVTAGWNYEGVAWYAPVSGGDPVYRLYNPNSGDHHYTMDTSERDWLVSLGWQYEGVAWNSAPEDGVPQYRLWNPNADLGSHHYTSSTDERDYLVSLGWVPEGIGWYGSWSGPVTLQINTPDFTTLLPGDTLQLEYEYSGDDSELTWSVSDDSVLTVNNSGKVTAIAAGSAAITVSDGTKSATCTVTVTAPAPAEKTLKIKTNKTTISIGDTLQIEYEYSGDNSDLTWKSADESVVTVDNSGKVTAVGAGDTLIKVTDGTVSAKVGIKVAAPAVKTTSIEMSNFNAPLSDGVIKFAGDYMEFKVWTLPAEGNRDITVTSSDSSVVSVSWDMDPYNKNWVTLNFNRAGSATITITSGDGSVSQSYTIHVKSDYACNPGKSKLTPEEFAYCATQVVAENGFTVSSSASSYKYVTLSDDELTWEKAKQLGQSWVHQWWPNGSTYVNVVYQGIDENGNHLFFNYH